MQSDYSKEVKENLISQLNKKLIECMENNKSVSVHLHTDKVITRITIVPEVVDVKENELCLEYKSFYFISKHKIDYIEYVEDYDYDCYYVKIGNTEMFFDFI